ncbi:hypothetical protein ScPMuIL_013228 [Solemya velum]
MWVHHTQVDGGTPHTQVDGGTPHTQIDGGTPHTQVDGGTPHTQVNGGTPHTQVDGGTPHTQIDGGTPHTQVDGGTPHTQVNGGTPHTQVDGALRPPEGESCEHLYTEMGIRRHGSYHLKTGEITSCHFLDGTECEYDWIGYGMNCYLLSTYDYNFSDANRFCRDMDSNLVSVVDEEEQEFLSRTIQGFPDFNERSFHLGLYDHHQMSSFVWTDGNLFSFSGFYLHEPSHDINQCASIVKSEQTTIWYDADCSSKASPICKKSADVSPPYGCVEMGNDTANMSKMIFQDSQMTLTLCIQACQGNGTLYALVHDNECYCTETRGSSVMLPWRQCDKPCPGHLFQACGGIGSDTIMTFILIGDGHRARSCTDLEAQGITGHVFRLQQGNNSVLEDCSNTNSCPRTWVTGDGSCYKFVSGAKKTVDAVQYCGEYDSYPVSINDATELDFLVSVIESVKIFSDVGLWRIGLAENSPYTHLYRWSDGHRFNPDLFNFDGLELNVRSVLLNNGEVVSKDIEKYYQFICEKSSVYLGCYAVPDHSEPVLESYPDMMVPLCVELCWGQQYRLGMIQKANCYCSDSVAGGDEEVCGRHCGGQSSQLCGGETGASVYDAGQLASSATSCAELFESGIHTHGQYIVDGHPTFCEFMVDNSHDLDQNCSDDWLRNRGNCYKLLSHVTSLEDAKTQCKEEGSVLTSIVDEAEFNFIVQAIKGIRSIADNDGILIGLLDGPGMETASWSNGRLATYVPWQSGYPHSYHVPHTLLTRTPSSYLYTDKEDIHMGAVCQKNKDDIGCFSLQPGAVPVLEGYSLMELTLCRQLCQTVTPPYKYAAITTDACYCHYSVADMEAVTTSQCDLPCPGNSLQRCGSNNVVNIYTIDGQDIADSCGVLYRHGVVYQAVYLLRSVIFIMMEQGTTPTPAASGQTVSSTIDFRREQCGFTGNCSSSPFTLK